jgi:hypothetical protein
MVQESNEKQRSEEHYAELAEHRIGGNANEANDRLIETPWGQTIRVGDGDSDEQSTESPENDQK